MKRRDRTGLELPVDQNIVGRRDIKDVARIRRAPLLGLRADDRR